MANRNFPNSRLYTGHVMPVQIDCSFKVAAADTGGLGITGLTGAYVQNVFMHTSQTPGAGNTNPSTPGFTITNPNPPAGTIIVQLQDVFSGFYSMTSSIESPLSGSGIKIDNSALTAGVGYVISVVGDASLATWQGVGLPVGVTPALGASFIASGTGGSGNASSSRVQIQAAAGSGIFAIEILGNPNKTIAPSIQSNGMGTQLILQCRNDSSSDASVVAAPADNTVINLTFLLSNSSVQVGGS